MLYKIVRFYVGNKPKHTVRGKTGLYLNEAKAHCHDPQTRSETCTSAAGRRRTRRFGAWFEGWTEDK